MSKYNKWDFTENNINRMNSLEKKYYLDMDPKVIFDTLNTNLQPVSFSMYLKRYIHNLAPDLFQGNPEDYDDDQYREIIVLNFRENNVPNSFQKTSTTLMQSAKNWLKAKSVDRNVVFLLGFGLRMSLEEINNMLIAGLQQQAINSKIPREAICYWCYKNEYTFHKFTVLWQEFENLKPRVKNVPIISFSEETKSFRDELYRVRSDEELMDYLAALKTEENKPIYSVTMKKHYDALFKEAQKLIARLMNTTEEYSKYQTYKPEDITEATIENIISAAIPTQQKGNLMPAKMANLPEQVADKRFYRQRAEAIRKGETEINRFDLITLSFLNHALRFEETKDPVNAYEEYIISTNRILNDCFLGDLYPLNLYECFTMMCMLSEEPLADYNEVFELAYQK